MYIKKQTENPSAAYFLSSRTFDSISISLLHESPYIKRAVYTRRLNHSSTEADYRTRIPSGDQAAHAAVAGARSSQTITNIKRRRLPALERSKRLSAGLESPPGTRRLAPPSPGLGRVKRSPTPKDGGSLALERSKRLSAGLESPPGTRRLTPPSPGLGRVKRSPTPKSAAPARGAADFGAGDRTRTGTLLPTRDFKSLVSTIPPHRRINTIIIYHLSGTKSRTTDKRGRH